MVLAGPESGVIKIDCSSHPPILGAKRLLQHNLFNGGSPGRMYVAGGWKVACRSGRMIERYCVTSPGTLVWECEISTHDHNFFLFFLFFIFFFLSFFFACECPPPVLVCHLIQLYVLGRELNLTLAK